ncbi:MAG: cell division protein FtsK [Candidatus Moraniibacteriota bacterium]|nr:MAG: cell division protein FtsK [Candidatus Moranbacteria bacterium]
MSSQKKQNEEYEGDGEEFVSLSISSDAKRTIFAICFFPAAIIFALSFFGAAGVLGEKLNDVLSFVFGAGKYVAPLVFLYTGIILLKKKVDTGFYVTKIIGISFAFWGILALLHVLVAIFSSIDLKEIAASGKGGGYLGYFLGGTLVNFTGNIAAVIVLTTLIVIGLIVAFNMSFIGAGDRVSDVKKAGGFFKRKKKEKAQEEEEEDGDEYEDEEDEFVENDEDYEEEFDDSDFDDEEFVEHVPLQQQPLATQAAQRAEEIIEDQEGEERQMQQNIDIDWDLPPLKLLQKGKGKAKGGDVKQRAVRIQETFENFGIAMELEDITTGPTVTQYSFRPQSGVKLSRITALNADLALALAAHPIRIEAPIPGKSLVGIEVPNKARATVRMRDLLNTDEFDDPSKKLLLALGEDVNGDYVFEDLTKMPHLLVAGTTGSGKSVTINCMLLSLLYKNAPDELKLILVDPKRVELSLYSGIPHLLSDVIVDNGKVVNALKWAVNEMERRYKILQESKSRNLTSYEQKREAGETYYTTDVETGQQIEEEMEKLPVIVIVIDELSDLMASNGKEVEGLIVRLAQKSRAIGIHLIISTQRPSVEVITGLIKANLPTRIALRVATNIDSRTIIDVPGAEKLIGNGDMLFVGPQSTSPHRLQSAFVEESEVKKVVDYVKRQAKEVGAFGIDEDFDGSDSLDDFGGGFAGGGSESDDPIYEEAKDLVIKAGKASTSYIQRRLRVGYSRAARLMDELEDNGIVGPSEGSKPRKVLVGGEGEDDGGYDDE